MRGCTDAYMLKEAVEWLFPAHAGMHPSRSSPAAAQSPVPRACGDAPPSDQMRAYSSDCSPRMRGCTAADFPFLPRALLFPAHAGMHRRRRRPRAHRKPVPRACGDAPAGDVVTFAGDTCSPRMRGCTAVVERSCAAVALFPAHAGMHRPPRCTAAAHGAVPRACGDAPTPRGRQIAPRICSPRMRGCTAAGLDEQLAAPLFPAHAGMHRHLRRQGTRLRPVPRACGDAPKPEQFYADLLRCSPRMRGCTDGSEGDVPAGALFPAHAGMHRDGPGS